MTTLTRERVLELLQYNSETGDFTWLVAPARWKAGVVGSIAGSINKKGYRYITIDGKKLLAHRLAWFVVYGTWPTGQVDHANRVKGDNRIDNLRDASPAQNQQNQCEPCRNSASGVRGVVAVKRRGKSTGKFSAYIEGDGVKRYLGTFGTTEAAQAAYLSAKLVVHEGRGL